MSDEKDKGEAVVAVDPLADEAMQIDAQINLLLDANCALGAKIDAIRDERRGLLALVAKLQARRSLITVLQKHPEAKDAIAPGAVVTIDSATIAGAIAKAFAGNPTAAG